MADIFTKDVLTAVVGIIIAVGVIIGVVYFLLGRKKTPKGPETPPPSEPPIV